MGDKGVDVDNNRLSGITLLLATERSGTHMLRSMLGGRGDIATPGELCNANADADAPNEFSFFDFRYDLLAKAPELRLPTPSHQRRILREYFSFIKGRRQNHSSIVCDIKYSHIHNFNSFWWDPFSRPFLIEFAKQASFPIIHLVRKNVFQTAFSEMYAQKTGVWRAKSKDEIVFKKIHVDLRRLQEKAQDISRQINAVRGWLANVEHREVHYESLTGDDALATLNLLRGYLHAKEVMSYKSDFIKTTPPYNEIIENYGELREFLKG